MLADMFGLSIDLVVNANQRRVDMQKKVEILHWKANDNNFFG